ncbi:2,4-dichlorophenol 6-monooxygenase [Paramyrothecium foliicola]|nr:2,4-dichlorophenol 6-monooxygenase [Paramyrothecium foliicola]
MEPLLVKYATHRHFDIRFKTELVDARILADGTNVCTIRDLLTMSIYQVNARFLFGADGGKSVVAGAFPFTYTREPPQGVACNVSFSADLGHLTRGREAQLYWILQPDTQNRFGRMNIIRTVRPWDRWMMSSITPGATSDLFSDLTTDTPGLADYIKVLIGDSTVDIKIDRVDIWTVRETVANHYSSRRTVHLLGDAAHRHPPAHGMGSNISVQDAYNLAWKVAFVTKGLAGPELLDSYNLERQPVGANLVKESNDLFRTHVEVMQSLGLLAETAEERTRQLHELKEHNAAGAARRELLYAGLEARGREGRNIGLAMNQKYVSKAIYLTDEPGMWCQPEGDPVTQVNISTYPGSRLPHAWLGVTADNTKRVSTQDLAGKASFCLLTGNGGQEWRNATVRITNETNIPINHYAIGFGLGYYDKYRDWQRIREIDENGCLLVRPDRVVAWGAQKMVSGCHEKLLEVLDTILSRDSL